MSVISNGFLGKCSKCGLDVSPNTLTTHSCEALKLAQKQIEQLNNDLVILNKNYYRLRDQYDLLKEKNKKLVEALNEALEENGK